LTQLGVIKLFPPKKLAELPTSAGISLAENTQLVIGREDTAGSLLKCRIRVDFLWR
jgi:hypothetical protein